MLLRLETMTSTLSQDMYGFNLAGLHSIRYGMETAGTPVFADVAEKLNRVHKKKKLTSYTTS